MRSDSLIFVLLIAIMTTVTASVVSQTVFSVPSAQYPTIQSAINAAAPGDVVAVGPGTFFENIDFLGKAISVLGSGIGVSIIDGNQSGSVVSFTSNEIGAVLDGFTITNGSGNQHSVPFSAPVTLGGGIDVYGPGFSQYPVIMDVTVRNCEITSNQAADGGGGVSCYGWGGLKIEDCVISSNQCGGHGGGGIGVEVGFVSIRRCTVIANSAARYGGGIAVSSAPIAPPLVPLNEVVDCDVDGNVVPVGGSGPFRGGGGIWLGGGSILVERCRIRSNFVQQGLANDMGWGGGIWGGDVIRDCLIEGNQAGIGGAFFQGGTLAKIVNCTIVNNSATSAGVIRVESGNISIDNSIVWGNTPDIFSLGPQLATLAVNHTCIQPGYTGPGSNNFSHDPRFVYAPGGDFHLRGDSPCISMGNATNPNLGSTDIDGDPRLLYGKLDLGADEMSDASRDAASSGNVTGTGVPEQVLRVAGSNGSRARRVSLGIGQQFRISMIKPILNAGLARFAIYGLLRTARYDDVIALPAGIGSMVFPPCILLPSQLPTLFTLTNNFPIGPCGSLIPSTPAPWTSQAISIPIPFTFTIQGLIEETPGVVRTTNAVIVEVR